MGVGVFALHFRSEELLTFLDVYKDTRYAPHRPVTDLRPSPTFPELFLAAYGSPSSKFATPEDSEGCVLVWSLALKQRPEYVFTCQVRPCGNLKSNYFSSNVPCNNSRQTTRPYRHFVVGLHASFPRLYLVPLAQSAVCSALFNKFQPYVIVGGTYGGSIVIWDSRAQVRTRLRLHEIGGRV